MDQLYLSNSRQKKKQKKPSIVFADQFNSFNLKQFDTYKTLVGAAGSADLTLFCYYTISHLVTGDAVLRVDFVLCVGCTKVCSTASSPQYEILPHIFKVHLPGSELR